MSAQENVGHIEPVVQVTGQDEAKQAVLSTEQDEKAAESSPTNQHVTATSFPHTVFGHKQRIVIILTGSFAGFVSPVSASIYLPALNTLADQLNVSNTAINLTITSYMIFQAIAPTFIANFSDHYGRRPAYLVCFVIYLAANIGLALQSNYAALFVLRCVQSSGSSGTVALGSAIVADVSTRAERGKFIGYAAMGITLGPALGPIIGGLLDHYLGWRAIFWFLVIFSGVMLAIIVVFLPETCRAVVGNGSVPVPKWNKSVIQIIYPQKNLENNVETLQKRRRRPNPFITLRILVEKETSVILITSGLLYAGLFGIISTLPSLLQKHYGFNSIQIGLCYLPYGVGSLISRWTVGRIVDWNFRRHAAKNGIEIVKNRQQDLDNFPIEKARLQITLPVIFVASAGIITYGWVINYRVSLAAPLVVLFIIGSFVSGGVNTLNTLVVDCHHQTPATAVAAANLMRCLLGAGAVAAAIPVVDSIGVGWAGTIVGLLWVLLTLPLWAVMTWGPKWREEQRLKEEKIKSQKSKA